MELLKYTAHQGLAPKFQCSRPGDSRLDQFSDWNNPRKGHRHREQNPIVTADSRSGAQRNRRWLEQLPRFGAGIGPDGIEVVFETYCATKSQGMGMALAIGRSIAFYVLLATSGTLVAAPPEPIQKPVSLLGLGEGIERAFLKLTDTGITPFLAYYGVLQGNPVGGIQQRIAYTHLLLFGATLNFDNLLCIPGGSITISGAEATGKNLSDDIGNINTVSEAFVRPLTVMFYELYWKQLLFDDKLELRCGRMTPADQFASVPAFGLQVSGGINGNPTSIFVNAPFTSSPNATWAASVRMNITEEIYAEAGVYQAGERLDKIEYHGLNFAIDRKDGELVLAQVGWEPTFFKTPETTSSDKSGKKTVVEGTLGLPGNYILGGYYSNFRFQELNSSNVQTNAYGFYAMGQQTLWRGSADPYTTFSLWGGLTFSPQQDISLLPLMGFAGTIWQGVVPGRDRDQFLLTYLVSSFSRDHADALVAMGGKRPTSEHVLEAGYAIYITDNYTIQPDIQYIIRPNGTNGVTNALVLGIQFVANF
jgi:porin